MCKLGRMAVHFSHLLTIKLNFLFINHWFWWLDFDSDAYSVQNRVWTIQTYPQYVTLSILCYKSTCPSLMKTRKLVWRAGKIAFFVFIQIEHSYPLNRGICDYMADEQPSLPVGEVLVHGRSSGLSVSGLESYLPH